MPDICKTATLPNKNGPRVDIMREVRYIYNHKSPKMSRKKNYKSPRRTRARSRAAAPLFTMRKGDTNPTENAPEIDRQNQHQNAPKNHPRNRPEITPENTPPEPLQILDRQSHAATQKPAPRFTGSGLGPPWVRTGSAPYSLETLPHTAILAQSPRHIPTYQKPAIVLHADPAKHPRTQSGPSTGPITKPPFLLAAPAAPILFI